MRPNLSLKLSELEQICVTYSNNRCSFCKSPEALFKKRSIRTNASFSSGYLSCGSPRGFKDSYITSWLGEYPLAEAWPLAWTFPPPDWFRG